MWPVCVKCQVEYKPKKNGVEVIEMFLDPPQPYKLYSADMWACPKCGHEIIIGFSDGLPHHALGFDEWLAAMKTRKPFYVYEH